MSALVVVNVGARVDEAGDHDRAAHDTPLPFIVAPHHAGHAQGYVLQPGVSLSGFKLLRPDLIGLPRFVGEPQLMREAPGTGSAFPVSMVAIKAVNTRV
jgi:hypothetical protein